ncbi:MAG: ABC transporter ATP-binding protein [Alphaproteobacteria bacterium RIFCSPLOWO2_01_FULL_40_26]|nr:MAG: ABC transporter ATP-binding protein [Alphaproteobacteria bacterium RIFCSPHIGHO2_02_FULL_40_34]OFW88321.1 MAG: ABC transporter ATP-binding protein [Alphaproteobacteria bacterium RIFCSPHIGHO2_01_FULL_40_8]OFW94970.1 MAG: ABC transporter ATP-binding protein [Alphaproteobacteria bacterium RIFCSPLOWO2_01_FULL_40_26]OFX09883.1 MAG: ABC transporter ATP-binding protein [Alphaproteobacteria bacterium RIFCSPLOWO2_02_FULL_40_19]OFX10932.1 MAG: ABC transporter ATP-binding protein [Alphaproteobacter
MTAKLVVKNLIRNFGEKKVLTGIDLQVNQGESVVILGGSGSGKSVLIKIIATLIAPTSGSIKVDGQEVSNIRPKDRDKLMEKFGFLFQGGALFDSLSVWENVAFRLLYHKKMSKKDAREIALQKLKAVGLNEKTADLFPSELSGGMQKRASLARAIAANPEIIFFDEPTTGLDPIMADVINDLIIANSKKLGATTITITHDMHSARKIADKVAMLYDGKIIWFGDVKDMYSSGNTYLDQFIHGRAEGPINFLIS